MVFEAGGSLSNNWLSCFARCTPSGSIITISRTPIFSLFVSIVASAARSLYSISREFGIVTG
jgi:hypothetical protein